MRRLTASLVAAATGALALIPLASASAATTSTPVASSATLAGSQTESHSWAGWVDTMNKPGGYHQFKGVEATFKVPGINCSGSVIGSKRYPGGPYSAAAFWVGLDGTNSDSNRLEQAGITGTCASKTSSAQYYAWYQMTPFTVVKVSLAGLRAGDSITVAVEDTDGVTPYSPKFGNPADAGYSYSVSIKDSTRGSSYYKNGLRPDQNGLPHGSRAPDSSAEVITEAVSNGPYNTPHATGLADMGTVNYTDVNVSSFASGWIYGMSMKSTEWWTATAWNAGHEVWPEWRTLINPGSLSGNVGGGPSPFSTYWK
jgi:hypothetical protein